MAGDINGQIVGKENLNVDATFAGDLQVKAVIEVASEPLYKMSADLVIKTYVLSGTFVIQGTGSLKGIQITGTISGTLGDTTATLAGTQVIVHP
jgi:cytoskeletal protein CcmA (bactofilin family)